VCPCTDALNKWSLFDGFAGTQEADHAGKVDRMKLGGRSASANATQGRMEDQADHVLALRFPSRFVGDTPWLYMDSSGHGCKGGLDAV